MSVFSTKGFTFHDDATASIDEIVANFYLNGGSSPGVAFARKVHCSGASLAGKDAARGRIINLYDSDKWPMPLTILTMPGLKWIFERQLLQRRGKLNAQSCRIGHTYPKARTFIVGIENDEMIYRGALKYIPRAREQSIQLRSARSVKTNYIHRYMAMDVEEYIEHELCPFFDAAWFDFTGFLTERRLKGIKNFWKNNCGLLCTITTLSARWSKVTSKKIKQAGGLGQLIQQELDATILNEFTYADGGVPMHQITLIKKNPSMVYFGYDPFPHDTVKGLTSYAQNKTEATSS